MKRGLLTARLICFVLCATLLCPILIGCGNSGETFSITYRSYLTPMEPITDSRYTSYNSAKGLRDLPNPVINNYVFLGWYTDGGEEVREILPGTTGDIILNAYWTSKRNLTRAVKEMKDPVIINNTDDGVIYFAYELGTMENVPLSDAIWTIQSVSGLAQQKSEEIKISITEEQAEEITKAISKATVDSSTWTLSQNWNDVVEINEEWAKEQGLTKEEALEKAMTSSNTICINDSKGGVDTTTTTDGTTSVNYNSKNHTTAENTKMDFKAHANVNLETSGVSKLFGGNVKVDIGAEVSNGVEHKDETNTHTGTDTTTVDTEVKEATGTWNKTTTSSSTLTESQNESVKEVLSQVISETYGYGKSYGTGGEEGKTGGFSSSENESTSSTSTLRYITSEEKTTTTTYSTDGMSEGWYRMVMAGTVHVFGVVGYDAGSQSFFTYTYSVLDDKTYEFLDYSPDGRFNDYENGVLPFEIPYFVYEYVTGKTASTKGLTFETNSKTKTAKVTGFDNDTETDVIIPSYITAGDTAYRVTGLSTKAFAGKGVEAIILSDFIDEIPAGAFKNCTALKQISGAFSVIGDEAFNGCTSLENFTVSNITTSIGLDAFKGVPNVKINILSEDAAMEKVDGNKSAAVTLTQNLVKNAAKCGAQNVTMDISKAMPDAELTITASSMENFTLIGGKDAVHKNLRVTSDADTTVLKELTIRESTRIPLEISSKNLTMEVVDVETSGFALLLGGSDPVITLVRDNNLVSANQKAILCKTPKLISEKTDNVSGKLTVSGNVYVNGTSVSIEELSGVSCVKFDSGKYVLITEEEYAQYLKGTCKVTFNANGGSVSTQSKTITFGGTYGTLPVPTWTGHSFNGWFTAANGGTKVTSSTKVTAVSSEQTLYAQWTVNAYTANWKGGTGYAVEVRRTASPYAGAATGVLSSGDAVYYGDILSISYTADIGYTFTKKGNTSITVSTNVTSSHIYASVAANSYTYNVVYKSVNGTALGSTTATYKYGTTNTISAPAKVGYTTPAAQSVKWDSTSAKTITFVYTPVATPTTQQLDSGWWWRYSANSDVGVKYDVKVEYKNRTATSVEVRVIWTQSINKASYGYAQTAYVSFWNNSQKTADTGHMTVVGSSRWPTSSYHTESVTTYSDWITVPLTTTNAVNIGVACGFWDNITDGGFDGKEIRVPAY